MGKDGAGCFEGRFLYGIVGVFHPGVGGVLFVDAECDDVANEGLTCFDAACFVGFGGVLEPLVAVDFDTVGFQGLDCSVNNFINLKETTKNSSMRE